MSEDFIRIQKELEHRQATLLLEQARVNKLHSIAPPQYRHVYASQGLDNGRVQSRRTQRNDHWPESPKSLDTTYQTWLLKNFPRPSDLDRMKEACLCFQDRPLISLIMPVFNTPEQYLRKAINSVKSQLYTNWELCIADDCSTQSHVRQILEEVKSEDSRIKVTYRDKNGHISACSNSALTLVNGEFVALFDHDDLLTPDALYEVLVCLNQNPDTDMIYSDEDKIDENGYLQSPYFKPDWSPESLLSRMYTCHFGVYRRSLIEEIGGFREGYEGSQDYDLVLRFTEKTNKIRHIPKILYHWRIHESSTASSLGTKDYAYEASKKALSDALQRRGGIGTVESAPGPHGYHIVRYRREYDSLVSIVIPTRNLGDILNTCLKSIHNKTAYQKYEILLVDNGTTEARALDVIQKWKKRFLGKLRVLDLDIPFNYSKLNNYAVEHANGEYILLLNNDIEVLTPDWLEAMVEYVQQGEIGAVGAKLLYPDDTIQHAGVVAGLGGVAGHAHRLLPKSSPGYFNQLNTLNNYAALTGACLMLRTEVYRQVGGLEERLAVAFNDVDLCFKLIEQGYRNVYLPHVCLYHHESKSRGSEDTERKRKRFHQEVEYMKETWCEFISNDPFYNRNLSRNPHSSFSLCA